MSQQKIRQALEKRLAAWATINNVPVVFQNTPSDNTSAKYIQPKLIPAQNSNPSFGVQHIRYSGTLRVLVKVQSVGKGLGEVEALAESLAAYFPRGNILEQDGQSLMIEQTPTIRSDFIDGMYNVVPVDINYRSDSITI